MTNDDRYQTYYLNIGNTPLKLQLSPQNIFYYYWNHYLTVELSQFLTPPTKEEHLIRFVGPVLSNFLINPPLDTQVVNKPFKIGNRESVIDASLNTRYFQIILEQILMNRFQKTRKTILHASAINIGGAAVVVTGPSGSGKSTILRKLLPYGHPLTDDLLIIEQAKGEVLAYPSPFNSKISLENTNNQGYPIKLVIFPVKSNHIRLTQSDHNSACLNLCNQAMSLLNSPRQAKLVLHISSCLASVSFNLQHSLNQSIIKEIRKKLS